MSFKVIAECVFDTGHARIVQPNTLIPPLGAVRIPVDGLYINPWLETILMNEMNETMY